MTESNIARNLTFVVGTGRCGSTMLSRILREHPDVLSLSEFFGAMYFSTNNLDMLPDMDGEEVWQVMSAPDPFMDSVLRAGLPMSEILYPSGRGRFSVDTGIPKICGIVLPSLTDDPDTLYDRLAAEVPQWPRRSAAGHCLALFAFLARVLDRNVVVERTGLSLAYVQRLHDDFPQARFVHLYRDGPDCALSMSHHPAFRYYTFFRAAALDAGLPWPSPYNVILDSLTEEFDGLLTTPIDAERFMSYPLPLIWFAERWSQVTTTGMAALRELPGDLWMSLRYEDLLAEPEAELTRLAEFAAVTAPPDWLAFAQRLIHQRRTGTARASLDPDTLRALEQVCAPGTQAIQDVPSASLSRG
jgi:hypothetical protein